MSTINERQVRTLGMYRLVAILTICLVGMLAMDHAPAQAGEGTEFSGSVLKVDHSTGKFAVKKDGGGTRFTFTANEKTKFSGTGLASLKDLKKGDRVMVLYQVQDSLYLAASVARLE